MDRGFCDKSGLFASTALEDHQFHHGQKAPGRIKRERRRRLRFL
jgi:hypothetical protein